MSKWLLTAFVAVLGAAFLVTEADARRLGGARSLGTQRSVTAPPAKPAQQQAAPAQQQPSQAAPAANTGSRWLPILGGLALGGMLGYLFGGSGLVGILLLAALALGAALAIRALMRRRAEEPAQPVQFAGMKGETMIAPSQLASPQAAALPSGFDAAGFLRGAKLNFVRLQIANDLGKLDEVREFTTEEMFEELKKDVVTRASAVQQTDVVALEAELLEVATERDRHWASVRFSGMVRETRGTEPVPFQEIWNLAKPTDGSSGWLLAGIQQMH